MLPLQPGVVITTLNESTTIGPLVEKLAKHFRVYVVDDGSIDGTPAIAVNRGARQVINNKPRLGIGPCLMLGWQAAIDDKCTHIVQLDAGGSHDPDAVAGMVRFCQDYYYDMVIGSRFQPYGSDYIGRPWRAFLSRLAAGMCNLAQGGVDWHDWTSGYRVFTADAAGALLKRRYIATMHGWQIETLAYAGEMGFVIGEYPIVYAAGRSSFNSKIAWEAFRVWTHIIHHVGWYGMLTGEMR